MDRSSFGPMSKITVVNLDIPLKGQSIVLRFKSNLSRKKHSAAVLVTDFFSFHKHTSFHKLQFSLSFNSSIIIETLRKIDCFIIK